MVWGIGDVAWSFFWFFLFIAFVVCAVGTVVHFVRSVHAPTWAAILLGVLMFALPYITLIMYWLVFGVIRATRRTRSTVS
jgi:hypothetical protein